LYLALVDVAIERNDHVSAMRRLFLNDRVQKILLVLFTF